MHWTRFWTKHRKRISNPRKSLASVAQQRDFHDGSLMICNCGALEVWFNDVSKDMIAVGYCIGSSVMHRRRCCTVKMKVRLACCIVFRTTHNNLKRYAFRSLTTLPMTYFAPPHIGCPENAMTVACSITGLLLIICQAVPFRALTSYHFRFFRGT